MYQNDKHETSVQVQNFHAVKAVASYNGYWHLKIYYSISLVDAHAYICFDFGSIKASFRCFSFHLRPVLTSNFKNIQCGYLTCGN